MTPCIRRGDIPGLRPRVHLEDSDRILLVIIVVVVCVGTAGVAIRVA